MKLSLKTVVAVSLLLLTLNAAYIWALPTATIFYMGNVLAHLVIGIIFCAAGALLLTRDAALRARPLVLLAAAAMTAALAFGAYLVYRGNMLELRWALNAHIAAAILGVVMVVAFAWGHRASGAPGARGFSAAMQAATVLLLVLPVSAALWAKSHPNPKDRIVNPLVPPMSMTQEGGGPSSPFFPSSAKTNVGGVIPSNFFMDSELCGECHKDVYEQWKGSVHHFASFNNQFYRKSIEYMQDTVGTQPSKWCAGCHDHAVFFNGRFDKPIKDQIDTPEAHAGLACTSCHSITHVEGTMGNGGFTIEYPPLHELATSRNPVMRAARSLPHLSQSGTASTLVHEAVHAAGSVGVSALPATRCTSMCR